MTHVTSTPTAREALLLNFEEYGSRSDTCPPVVLIAGVGRSLRSWPAALVDGLARADLRVIAYDHRDTGRSPHLCNLPDPDLERLVATLRAGKSVVPPYTLDDIAHDFVDLLDSLKIERAHVVGASMGGMVAQLVASRRPERVESLTLMRTSSGNPGLPSPHVDVLSALLNVPRSDCDVEQAIAYERNFQIACASARSALTQDDATRNAIATISHGWHAAGIRRHLAAVMTGRPREELLAQIAARTLVIHGTHDRVVDMRAAHDLCRMVSQARLLLLEGAGHDIPQNAIAQVVNALLQHFSKPPFTSSDRRHALTANI